MLTFPKHAQDDPLHRIPRRVGSTATWGCRTLIVSRRGEAQSLKCVRHSPCFSIVYMSWVSCSGQYSSIFVEINKLSAERQRIFYKGVERGCVGIERRSISIAAITNWTPSKTDNVGSITVPVGAGISRMA